jgi:hypothetical protein
MVGWKFTHFPRMKGRQFLRPICANILAAVMSVAGLRRPASLRCQILIQLKQCSARIGVIAALAQLAERGDGKTGSAEEILSPLSFFVRVSRQGEAPGNKNACFSMVRSREQAWLKCYACLAVRSSAADFV